MLFDLPEDLTGSSDPLLQCFIALLASLAPECQQVVAHDVTVRRAIRKELSTVKHSLITNTRHLYMAAPEQVGTGVKVRIIGTDPAYTK